MKKTHKIAGAGVLALVLSVPFVGLAPRVRTTDSAYYFDRIDTTIMIPRCGRVDNRDGCASNVFDAFLEWEHHK